MSKIALFIVLVVMLGGCGKASNVVPDVAVNLTLPLSDPRLLGASSAGGAVTISGYGVAGLIIYKTLAGGYVCFDRCSTVNPEKRCAVTLDAGAFTATDPCSGGKYLLEDGSPVKAPATISLKQYSVYQSISSIQITN